RSGVRAAGRSTGGRRCSRRWSGGSSTRRWTRCGATSRRSCCRLSNAPSPPRREARRGYQLRSLPIAWGGQEGMLAQLPPHQVGRLGGAASSASLPTGWGGKEGMLAQLLLAAGHGDVAVERRAVLDGQPAHAHVTVEPA